jgi:hypothetical protein
MVTVFLILNMLYGIHGFIRPVVASLAPGMAAEQRAMLFID